MRALRCRAMALAMATVLLFAGTAAAETLWLGDGLKLVTQQGRLVRIAAQDEAIARDDARMARAGFFPRVDASFGQTFLAHQPQAVFGDRTVPVSEKNFPAYSVSVQQTLYDFQRTAAHFAASRIVADTRKLDTRRIGNLAALDFALSYFDLLEAEKMVTVAQTEAERLQSHLKEAQDLYAEGVITKNDVLQVQVRLSDAGQRLIGARNARAVRASRINDALMRPLTTEVVVADATLLNDASFETDLERAWEAGLRERPEIKIAEETVKALDLETRAKRAEFYPEAFVRGSYDYTDNQYQVYDDNWTLLFGISVNLFSGGRTRAEVARLTHQRARLKEEEAKLIDDIKLEVQRNLLDMEDARQKIAAVKDAMKQAEENLRINRTRYREGVGTATEVLDAVTLLTVAETNNCRALYDLGRAEATAIFAQGRALAEAYR